MITKLFKRHKMDNPVFLADISWLRPEEGGRKSPIPMNQKQYAPIAAVDGQLKVSGSAWSLLCYSFEKKGDYETLAYVKYLNSIHNPNNLKPGSKFELFEGANKVAYGEIIEEVFHIKY